MRTPDWELDDMERFSQREGYAIPPDIKYRAELPTRLREPIVEILRQFVGSRFLLDRVERLIDPYGIDTMPGHIGSIPVSKSEDDPTSIAVKRILLGCDWFRIYDLIEDVIAQLDFHEEENRHPDEEAELRAYPLRHALNQYFLHAGIGWQISDGKIVTRGDTTFESTIANADAALQATGRPTAAKHLSQALRALSLRPEPNLSGAVFHSLGALESVARDVTGSPNATLGEIMKRQPGTVPKPLDQAIALIWGYASNEARHVREGVEPGREETTLIVSASAALIAYLATKSGPYKE